MKWIGAFLFLGALMLAAPVLAQSPPTQCLSIVQAGGTGDAIQFPKLPCWPTTTMTMMNVTKNNTTNSPKISVLNAGPPLPLVNFDGTSLAPGDLLGGQHLLLGFDGAKWFTLTGPATGNMPIMRLGSVPVGNGTRILVPSSITDFGNGVATIGNATSGFTADGARLTAQTSGTTTANIIAPFWGCQPNCFYDGIRSAINVPSGTTLQNANALAGYVVNNSAFTPSTDGFVGAADGIFTFDVCNVANCQTWGSNFNVQGTDHPGEALIGGEIDLTAYRTDTAIQGLALLGSSTAQPTAADGFTCGPLGTGIKWVQCFVVDSGAAQVAMVVGAAATSGANVAGQPFRFYYLDGAGIGHFYQLGVDSAGQFDFNIDGTNPMAKIGIGSLNLAGGPSSFMTIGGTDNVVGELSPHLLGIGSSGVTTITLGNVATTAVTSAAPIDAPGYAAAGSLGITNSVTIAGCTVGFKGGLVTSKAGTC